MKYIELLRRLLDLWSQKSDVVAKWVSARHCLSGGSTARFCDKQVFLSWVQKKVLGWCLFPQMLITSLSSTYFPCFDHFSCISWQRNFVRDIFPNISPPDHCLKLNPGTNAPWFELFDSESKSSGGWRGKLNIKSHRLQPTQNIILTLSCTWGVFWRSSNWICLVKKALIRHL